MTDLELRDVLAQPDSPVRIPKATITQVYADGTVDLETASGPATNAAVLGSYTPRIGDAVRFMRADETTLLVLGTIRATSATTVEVDAPLSMAWNVDPALSSPANPLVVTAIDAGSWRDGDGWDVADVRQGASSTRKPWWFGCYFYGAGAFSALTGRTITSATITVSRSVDGRDNEPAIIAPHLHAAKPATAPVFTADGVELAPEMLEGVNVDLSFPVEFAQQLADGAAAGIGHNYAGTADYAIFDALATDPLSGRLTLGWV